MQPRFPSEVRASYNFKVVPSNLNVLVRRSAFDNLLAFRMARSYCKIPRNGPCLNKCPPLDFQDFEYPERTDQALIPQLRRPSKEGHAAHNLACPFYGISVSITAVFSWSFHTTHFFPFLVSENFVTHLRYDRICGVDARYQVHFSLGCMLVPLSCSSDTDLSKSCLLSPSRMFLISHG